MSSNSYYLLLQIMEFKVSDAILKRRLNGMTDHTRSYDFAQNWLASDDGKSFLDDIMKPGDKLRVNVMRRVRYDVVDFSQTT